MITLDVFRGYATALPEVTEKPHFGRPGFRVRDKLFASVYQDGAHPHAIVHVAETEASAAVTDAPEMFEEVWRTHGQRRIFVGLRVDLLNVPGARCRELIVSAWRNRAPKRLVTAYEGR